MIRFNWYSSGDIFAVRYRFEQGDELPRHAHDDANEHNVTVLAGTVLLKLEDREIIGHAGDILDFDGSKQHSILCLSPYASTLNIWLHGMPAGYETLPASEHEGTL
jgi:Cupin domain